MRGFFIAVSLVALAACKMPGRGDPVTQAMQDVNAVDASNLNEVMLTVADPNEAVSYFERTLAENPGRVDIQRGLAASLVRAGRANEAVGLWQVVVAHPEATPNDRVDLADALIRAGDWKGAEAALDAVPPTHETFDRYKLEAMVADSNKEWQRADSFYEIAAGLTTKPAGVLNNWGFSHLSRGNFVRAEQLFAQAIRNDRTLFTAKNNLVLARGAQRHYDLPVIPMTQTERAQLLHTAGLSAVKQGDVVIARGLLEEAISTHPQHFEAAVRSLRALERNVHN